MARTKKRYWARRPLGYGRKQYDRGQVLQLKDLRNDETLLRLGYVTELEGNTTLHLCDECGAEFIGIGERTGHYKKNHLNRILTPDQEDARIEREEKRLQEQAPLYLDKTKASQES